VYPNLHGIKQIHNRYTLHYNTLHYRAECVQYWVIVVMGPFGMLLGRVAVLPSA